MDHDGCTAHGEPCALCCPAGELPELPPGFLPSYAVDVLLDQARLRPEHTATGRLGPSLGTVEASVAICPTCGHAINLSDIFDVLHHATIKHERRHKV
jgi:hypothetical protein